MTTTAYLTITRFSGNPNRLLEKYRKFSDEMSAVGRDHGLIMHAGAETDSGFLVVNLWPSKAGSEAAARDPRRLAVLEEAEISPDHIRREHHDVADFVVLESGGGAAASPAPLSPAASRPAAGGLQADTHSS